MDHRGRDKGDRRKWDETVVGRIVSIRRALKEKEPYWGPSAIRVEYRKEYPDSEVPPVRTIGKILADLGMTEHQENKSSPGALQRLNYPESSIYGLLFDRVLEVDFLGEKYLEDRTEPLNFLGFSFKREPRLRHYWRVKGKGYEEIKTHTEAFLNRFERPQAIKVDNASSMLGYAKHKRSLSRYMAFLLSKQIHPVFSVPKSPATQASIEGSNSVFGRKFWNRHEFDSIQDIEEKLEKFNDQTRRYLQYESPDQRDEEEEQGGSEAERPKVYFTRQVRENEEGEAVARFGWEQVRIPREWIDYFVLGEWDLDQEILKVRMEQEKEKEEEENEVVSKVIKTCDFSVHDSYRDRRKEILKSFDD